MTRTVFLRQCVASLPVDAIRPETRAAVLRHYDERIAAEWLAARYFLIESWGWN